jgi:outer membrane lipase/esterase
MRMPFRPVGARYLWIAGGLISSVTTGPASAWAQKPCDLSDVLRQAVGSVRSTADAAVTTGANIAASPAAIAATTNSAVQHLTGILQLDVEPLPSGTNPPPSVAAPLSTALDPLKPVVEEVDGTVEPIVRNLCDAVKGLGLQSGIAALTTSNLTGAILGRLDSVRVQGAAGGWSPGANANPDGKMSLGAAEKARPAPPPGTVGPLTVYAGGTFLGGNSSDLPNAAGFSYGGGSGIIGLEYSVNRNLILGVAGSFTAVDADLSSGGNIGANVVHGAAYLSYATRAWFVDALAAYGAIDLDLARPGANDAVVRGSTSGGAWAAAARGGYLFDFGKVRAGPIAGLTYVHARIDGYAETGPADVAMSVGEQTVDSLTGSAGVRFLAPFQAGGTLFVPYLNVTLEHHFGDGTAELTAGLAGSGGTQPLTVSFPTFGARDYGKVEGGLTIEFAPETSVSVSGASTFARDDGQDYRVSAGLNYRF